MFFVRHRATLLGAAIGVVITLILSSALRSTNRAEARDVGKPPEGTRDLVAERDKLRAECETIRNSALDPEEVKREVADLSERIRELKEGPSKETRKKAEELWDFYAKLLTGKGDMSEAFRMQALLRELGPESAHIFLAKYRDPKLPEDQRKMALQIFLGRGGETVSQFLLEYLNDPQAATRPDMMVVRQIATAMKATEPGKAPPAGMGMRLIPINDALRARTYELTSSNQAALRSTAAGILAWENTGESRSTLTKIATTDEDPTVRTAAIVSLGYVGDAATVAWLESLELSDEKPDWKDPESVRRFTFRNTVNEALRRLKHK